MSDPALRVTDPSDADTTTDRMLLAGLPDDPSRLLWPSQVWRDHETVCGHRLKRCPHVAELVTHGLPDWWWAAMKQRLRQPIDADPAKAVEVAMARINGYRGGPTVTVEAAACARD